MEPEGNKLTNSTLKQATLNLNSKLRRRGNISAFEINSSRDQNTGHNLSLDDQKLRINQINKRSEMHKDGLASKPVEIGDTVKVKNASEKHKANDIFIVTSKEDEHIGIQKLLHPLKKNPPKFMGKVYKTNQKYLHTIHRPKLPSSDDIIEQDLITSDTCNGAAYNSSTSPWNPIRKQFFREDDDDDDSDSEKETEEVPTVNSQQDQDLDSSHTSLELQWDHSPEQYQLDEELYETDFTEAIQPRVLFPPVNEDEKSNDTLTSEDASDDNVFHNDEYETPGIQPKLKRSNAMNPQELKRSNAMRLKARPGLETDPRSDQRVTRRMLSNPSSPYNINLNERQNLNNVLNPNIPLLPDLVNMGPRVQNLERALNVDEPQEVRRSARAKNTVNYLKFHEEGKKK